MSQIFDKLRLFDAYPKTLEDFRVKTFGGAAGELLFCIVIQEKVGILIFLAILPVTIISVTIMVLLFWVEFMSYLTPNVTEELFVDTSRSPKIQINLDVIFPKVSCDCKLYIILVVYLNCVGVCIQT